MLLLMRLPVHTNRGTRYTHKSLKCLWLCQQITWGRSPEQGVSVRQKWSKKWQVKCSLVIPPGNERAASQGPVWENSPELCLVPVCSALSRCGRTCLFFWIYIPGPDPAHWLQWHFSTVKGLGCPLSILLLLKIQRTQTHSDSAFAASYPGQFENSQRTALGNPRSIRNFEVGLGSCKMFLFLSFIPFSPFSGIREWLRKAEQQLPCLTALRRWRGHLPAPENLRQGSYLTSNPYQFLFCSHTFEFIPDVKGNGNEMEKNYGFV